MSLPARVITLCGNPNLTASLFHYSSRLNLGVATKIMCLCDIADKDIAVLPYPVGEERNTIDLADLK